MAQQPAYILKNKVLPDSQNLEVLKQQGIEMLKELSGSLWTDFNDHDPGITILEQLCYAMMEMSYKAHFDFEELFFANGSSGPSKSLREYFLFKKHEVAFSNPVTPLDFRKLILDHWNDEKVDLVNCWVIPSKGEIGKYSIYLHLDSVDKELEKEAVDWTKALFNSYRNIGEKCKEVIPLQHSDITYLLNLKPKKEHKLSNDAFVEAAAQSMFDLSQFVQPTIRYAKSIDFLELKEEEHTSLYTGPRPQKKFIHPVDLANTSTEFMSTEIDLQAFVQENSYKWEDILGVTDEAHLARLDLTNNKILVFNEETFLQLIKEEDLKQRIRSTFKEKTIHPLLNGEVVWDEYVPQSSILQEELADYLSIQHTFPANYQLGQKDISSLNPEEQTQIRNLQAYLLLFESLFVDFLVKLLSFPQFLSPDITEDQQDGFEEAGKKFEEILMTIPGAKELIKDPQSIKTLYGELSFDSSQRISLRTYALARYGEEFDTDLLKRAWGEPESFKEDWFKRLGELMTAYPVYSSARHNSFNLKDIGSDFPLSQKLAILLNKDYDAKQPVVYLLEEILVVDKPDSFGKLAIVIDLGEKLEDTFFSSKRQTAIEELIKNEFPFYLQAWFYYLNEEGEELSIKKMVMEETPKKILKREPFLKEYKNWRRDLSESHVGNDSVIQDDPLSDPSTNQDDDDPGSPFTDKS